MSIYTDQIRRLYKLAKKFNKTACTSFSQVGEKYDPKKFNRSKDG